MQSESMNAIDVAFQTEVSIESKSTEQLKAEANTFYKQAEQLAGMSAMMLAETGRRLTEVKNRIPHGEFQKWCEENLEFSYRKAARTMQLAEKMDDERLLATPALSEGLLLCSYPLKEASALLTQEDFSF